MKHQGERSGGEKYGSGALLWKCLTWMEGVQGVTKAFLAGMEELQETLAHLRHAAPVAACP